MKKKLENLHLLFALKNWTMQKQTAHDRNTFFNAAVTTITITNTFSFIWDTAKEKRAFFDTVIVSIWVCSLATLTWVLFTRNHKCLKLRASRYCRISMQNAGLSGRRTFCCGYILRPHVSGKNEHCNNKFLKTVSHDISIELGLDSETCMWTVHTTNQEMYERTKFCSRSKSLP